jgi:2-keto-4-pentenoate hydratase
MTDASPRLDPDLIAGQLFEQCERKADFHTLEVGGRPIDLDTAYRVQSRFVDRRLAASGGSIVGYKVGLTSQVMQVFCGVDEPVVGQILSGDVHAGTADLDPASFGRLGLECEMALRVGAAVPVLPEGADVSQLLGCVASAHAAFEIIDDRNADYTVLNAASIVAENSWNAGIILGPARDPKRLGNLDRLDGELLINGASAGAGASRDVLGGPLHVLAWLARFLARRNEALAPGQWIMTGSIVPTKFPPPGGRLEFTLRGLEPVHARIMNATLKD